MTEEDLRGFKRWFQSFTESFRFDEEEDRGNVALKVRHTLMVCSDIARIARGEGLGPEDVLMAEAVALFHDVGRFPQYQRYRTFMDAQSVNHGELGAKVIEKEKLLDGLEVEEQSAILTAVKYHNAFALPRGCDPRALLLLRLVRDADKLDIWRVFSEYYEGLERPSAAVLGLPDEEGYSGEIFSHLLGGGPAPMGRMRTLNDFRLVQLSWVNDLNFRTTFRLLLERDYIRRIAAHLPQNEKIRKAVGALRRRAEEMAGG
jgi:putative nucleotidyltransferase with HDIG domain